MKKTIKDVDQQLFADKRVFVRVDFNVPQSEDGTVADATRIEAALPTIEYLVSKRAKVVLASHLGRPKGKTEKLSLKPIAQHLAKLLNNKVNVVFADDCVGEAAEKTVNALKPGEICLLENLRFYGEEEKNDPEFCKKLAKLADIYVDDAFGTSHRAHASTEGITKFVRPALAGYLLEREFKVLSETLDNPDRPFATIIGGAKVSSKIGVLEHLLARVDLLLVGGAMAFTFLKARGLQVGKSLVEDDQLEYCKKLEENAKKKGVKIILPVDVVVAKEMKEGTETRTVNVDQIAADEMGLDVGPKTIDEMTKALSTCHTILWNGPLGVFEMKSFAGGTFALIDELIKLTGKGVKTVVGGGDSVAALKSKGVADTSLTHVSTGGGASLEFLEGLELPGLACLDEIEAAAAAKR
jgi:phosphoglycerate kinase